MTDERESHVVSGLRRKRAQIAGFVADHERKAREWRAALVQLDATLKLFSPDLDPETIPTKRVHRKSQHFGENELGRLILDELRRANGTPLTAIAFADIAMVAGDVPVQHHIRYELRQRITNYLKDSEKDGEGMRVGVANKTSWKLPPERLDSAQDGESPS